MDSSTCRRCMLFASKGRNTELLAEYLDSIPQGEWTPQLRYQERLGVCRRCPDHRFGMCRHCADYVEVRCAHRAAVCPAPEPIW